MISCRDLEDMGILDELTDTLTDKGLAGVLLAKINYPKSRTPEFTTPMEFWHKICSELEKGLIPNGLLLLVNAALAIYPHNNVFAGFCAENPIPNDSLIQNKKPRPGDLKATDKKIYISYSWGEKSEETADKLDETLQRKGIVIVRDKRDLGFKGRIKPFMRELGRGQCVIVIISDKYLKSENCMFEMLEIAKKGDFYNRIFPIVLDDAKIFNPIERIKYVGYWEGKIKELDEAMKGVSSANLQGFREDIDLYTEIRNTISDLTNILKDMNVLTPEIHEETDYNDLIEAMEANMAE